LLSGSYKKIYLERYQPASKGIEKCDVQAGEKRSYQLYRYWNDSNKEDRKEKLRIPR
jgi:hypothetical protein